MKLIRSGALALGIVAGVGCFPAGSALALPLGPSAGGAALMAQFDQAAPEIQVRYRGRRGGSGAVVGGIIGGMILGGIIASQQPRYYGYPAPVYPGYGVPVGDPIAYCMRRFKSYDPYSMTYLGYDGYRHRCP